MVGRLARLGRRGRVGGRGADPVVGSPPAVLPRTAVQHCGPLGSRCFRNGSDGPRGRRVAGACGSHPARPCPRLLRGRGNPRWPVSRHQIEFWSATGVLVGPLVGLAAAGSDMPGAWREHSARVLGGLLAGEAVYGLIALKFSSPAEYWHMQFVLGAVLAVGLPLWAPSVAGATVFPRSRCRWLRPPWSVWDRGRLPNPLTHPVQPGHTVNVPTPAEGHAMRPLITLRSTGSGREADRTWTQLAAGRRPDVGAVSCLERPTPGSSDQPVHPDEREPQSADIVSARTVHAALARACSGELLSGAAEADERFNLPAADHEHRLRWALKLLYVAWTRTPPGWLDLDIPRCRPGVQPQPAHRPAHAKYATTTDLAMRITQWLGRPAADFVYPAAWLAVCVSQPRVDDDDRIRRNGTPGCGPGRWKPIDR